MTFHFCDVFIYLPICISISALNNWGFELCSIIILMICLKLYLTMRHKYVDYKVSFKMWNLFSDQFFIWNIMNKWSKTTPIVFVQFSQSWQTLDNYKEKRELTLGHFNPFVRLMLSELISESFNVPMDRLLSMEHLEHLTQPRFSVLYTQYNP